MFNSWQKEGAIYRAVSFNISDFCRRLFREGLTGYPSPYVQLRELATLGANWKFYDKNVRSIRQTKGARWDQIHAEL